MNTEITIGFSNNIYDNPADVLGSVYTISENFHVIEIELAEEAQPAVLEATPAAYAGLVDSLRRFAIERSLRYSVHAPWHGPQTDLTSHDKADRRASVDLLERAYRFAVDIGATVVTCHPGYRHRQEERKLVENLVESLLQLRDIAPPSEVTVCVENMGAERPAFSVLSIESQCEVCERTGVAVCLDIVHLASVFPDTRELLGAVAALGSVVKHVHLGDMVRPSHRHLPIGMGDLPLDEVLQELAVQGYRGQAIVEEFTRGWTPEQYLSGALTFRDHVRALALAQ